MQYKLIITRSAQNDVLDAADWYEEQKKGLGKAFILSVEKRISLIIKNPFAFVRIYFQIRKANTQKFPYSLFCRVQENEIIIFAVIHNSRDANKWKNRI